MSEDSQPPTLAHEQPAAIAFLIIGGGPAAFSAARSYRKHGGTGRLVMITPDADAPYERPPLSKDFLRGESDEGALTMAEPGETERLALEITIDTARSLDPGQQIVRTHDGQTFTYTQCLLATGADPARLPVPGGHHEALLTLRSLADGRRLQQAARTASTAVVIGSGFIGCEAAVSLARLGLHVTQLSAEPAPQLRRLGPDAAERIAGWLREEKVELLTSAEVQSFEVDQDGVSVRAEGLDPVRADLVLLAVGVTPNCALAQDAGLPLHEGRIVTDARMRTPVAGLLAAGDVAFAENLSAGRHLQVEHWGEALTMGQIAGATAAGLQDQKDDDHSWSSAPGFWCELGERTLKYAAWGDGFEGAELRTHDESGFTIWYTGAHGATVGVLTHQGDDDYERGHTLVESAQPPPR
jgi:NADPH-dependent 2,4-dienoyl-CoA reductase/sulfur reductase-like enzyme